MKNLRQKMKKQESVHIDRDADCTLYNSNTTNSYNP